MTTRSHDTDCYTCRMIEADNDHLRDLNTDLTADFHRVQSELDAAEQERDELRGALRELVQAYDVQRTPRDNACWSPPTSGAPWRRALDVLGDDDGR